MMKYSIIFFSFIASAIWLISYGYIYQNVFTDYRDLATISHALNFKDIFITGSDPELVNNPYLYGITLSFILACLSNIYNEIPLIILSKHTLITIHLFAIFIYLRQLYQVASEKFVISIALPITFLFFSNTQMPLIVRPDALGVLFIFLAYSCLNFHKIIYKMIFISIFVILAYFSKQYFLFYSLPFFIYFLIKGCAAYFSIIFSVIFIASNIFVIKYIPNYLYSTIGLQSQATGGSFKYSFIQMFYLIVLLSPILLIFNKNGLLKSKDLLSKVYQKSEFHLIHVIVVFTSIPVILVIGTNHGAFITYHYQLLLPSIIFIIFATFDKQIKNSGILLTLSVFLVLQTQIITPVSKPILRAFDLYDEPKKTVNIDQSEEVVFISPMFYGVVDNYKYLDNGNLEYYHNALDPNIITHTLDNNIFEKNYDNSFSNYWKDLFSNIKSDVQECGAVSYITKNYYFNRVLFEDTKFFVEDEFNIKMGVRNWLGQKIRVICDEE